MKRFKVHIFCAIIACILLAVARSTHTVDLAEMFAGWKKAAVAALKERYDATKAFVGRTIISPGITAVIKSQSKAIIDNPYQNESAQVRIGNELHPAEAAYRILREPKVKVALEKFLNRSLDDKKIPVIAFVGSGGGYRAMLGTTGFLVGAENIGLLDTAMYITALSGSTWMLGSWTATGLTCADFRTYLEGIVIKSIFKVDSLDAREMADVFATKLAFNQPITTVDLFGALLANRLLHGFEEEKQMIYLSKQAERIQDGSWPYPIYTATDGSEKVWQDSHWYEFTPHEIGSAVFGIYVPTWAYGREFFAGKSLDFAPEQTLGFQFGTFGSAYSISFAYAWDMIAESISSVFFRTLIEKYVIAPIKGKRVFWAEVNNYMKGIDNIPNAYARLETRNTLKLIDAGITFNLPYPPVSGERPDRKADVLIFLDSSAGKVSAELKKVEEYARKRGLKLPAIDYTNLEKKACSIFKDEEDLSVPVIIYMPRVSDKNLWKESALKEELTQYQAIAEFDMEKCVSEEGGACTTFSFEYTEEQARLIMSQMEFNMIMNRDKIADALNWVIDRQSADTIEKETEVIEE